MAVAREHKRRGLPMDVIVIDFFHWTMQGDWRFDTDYWPDPAAMVRELEEMDKAIQSETNEFGDFESIWKGIQAETAAARSMVNNVYSLEYHLQKRMIVMALCSNLYLCTVKDTLFQVWSTRSLCTHNTVGPAEAEWLDCAVISDSMQRFHCAAAFRALTCFP